MGKFILNTLVILLVSVSITITLNIATQDIDKIDYNDGRSKHIAIIGPSTTGCAFDDAKSKSIVNLSRVGTEMPLMLPVLESALTNNPEIDTVLIHAGRHTPFLEHFEMYDANILLLRYQLPLIIKALEKRLLTPDEQKTILGNPNFALAMSYADFYTLIAPMDIPANISLQFTPGNGDGKDMDDPEKSLGTVEYEKLKADNAGRGYPKYNDPQFLSVLSRAIDICNRHGAVPVLFMPPLLDYDRWCKRSEVMGTFKQLDPGILVADYEDFQFPNTNDYYGDMHHLTTKGADYFTETIEREGLRYVRLSDWIEMHENPDSVL